MISQQPIDLDLARTLYPGNLHSSFRSTAAGNTQVKGNVYMYDSIQLTKTTSSEKTSISRSRQRRRRISCSLVAAPALAFGRCSVSSSRFRPAVFLKKVQARSHESQLRNLVGSRVNSPFPAAGPAKAPESVSSRPIILVTSVIGMVEGVPKSACRKDLFDRSRSLHQRDRRFCRWPHCLMTSSTRL